MPIEIFGNYFCLKRVFKSNYLKKNRLLYTIFFSKTSVLHYVVNTVECKKTKNKYENSSVFFLMRGREGN